MPSSIVSVLICATLASMVAAGCQSNAQQDLVARDRRMQEDQIYAMEEYLAQYQELVCKYRSENSALRRQMADGSEAEALAPRTSPRTRNGPRTPTNVPDIEVPALPRTNGTQPPQNLDLPDVPPLGETSADDPELEFQPGLSRGDVELTSAELMDESDTESVSQAEALQPSDEVAAVNDVWLRGEVVENEPGRGARLIVQVAPLDDTGSAATFDGTLSLMLLAPDGNGGQQSLARWDFSPEEVATASAPSGDGWIQFNVELPPETSVAEVSEMWVRLLPHGGEKVLGHAAIDLQQPGEFNSHPDEEIASEPSQENTVATAAYDELPANSPPVESDLYDGGWTIARPGDPAGASKEPSSQWRASMEPPPTVVADGKPARPTPRVSRAAPRRHIAKPAGVTHKPGGWSPERARRRRPGALPQSPTATTAERPRWSATR